MFDFEYKDPELVRHMEENFPEMTEEFRRICHEQYEVFCKKQHDYGKNNILLGGEIDNEVDRRVALTGIVIRIADKSNRLLNLVLKNTTNSVEESVEDTLQDLSNYGIIGQIISRAKWR